MKLSVDDSFSFIYATNSRNAGLENLSTATTVPLITYNSLKPTYNSLSAILAQKRDLDSEADVQAFIHEFGIGATSILLVHAYLLSDGYNDANGKHHIFDVPPQRAKSYGAHQRLLASHIQPILTLDVNGVLNEDTRDLDTVDRHMHKMLGIACRNSYKPILNYIIERS